MEGLTYEGQAISNLACELGFQRREVTSKEQLQQFYNQISIHPRAAGHMIALDGESVMLMISEEPKEKHTVVQHLLEELQRELTNQLRYEPTVEGLKRKQRMINKFANIIDAIEALPEASVDGKVEEIQLESVN